MPSGMRTASDILFGLWPDTNWRPWHYSIGLITSIPSFAADLFFASLFARTAHHYGHGSGATEVPAVNKP